MASLNLLAAIVLHVTQAILAFVAAMMHHWFTFCSLISTIGRRFSEELLIQFIQLAQACASRWSYSVPDTRLWPWVLPPERPAGIGVRECGLF